MTQPIVAVVGLGYVGLPLAVEFGKEYDTIGYDLSETKIANYKNYCDPTGACVHLMGLGNEAFASLITHPTFPPLVNIGTGEDLTIRELAELVKCVVGFEGAIAFDAAKPDGTPRKLMDVSRLHKLGWRAETPLDEGLRLAYRAFAEDKPDTRKNI